MAFKGAIKRYDGTEAVQIERNASEKVANDDALENQGMQIRGVENREIREKNTDTKWMQNTNSEPPPALRAAPALYRAGLRGSS